MNLYGFCGNNAINCWDFVGMAPPGETVLPVNETGNGGGLIILGGSQLGDLQNIIGYGGGADGGGSLDPIDPDSIERLARRLQGYIENLGADDLRRRFLVTQRDILSGLAYELDQNQNNARWTPDDKKWLQSVVKDFMDPLFAALDGKGHEKWQDTFKDIGAKQEQNRLLNALPDDRRALAQLNNELQATRAMALTHITEDLRKSIMKNGIGSDAQWETIGRVVSAAERANFNEFERLGSWAIGLFDTSYNVGILRDDMRNALKPKPPGT